MTTSIYINPAAFGAGQPLESMAGDKTKVRLPVGASESSGNRNGAGVGIQYATPELALNSARNGVTATIFPALIDDVQVNRWSQFAKNALADLVTKGVLLVERPPATPLTAAAIRAL